MVLFGASGEFWLVATVGMLAFNVRETVDNWWWDQLVTVVVWCFWGLVLSAPSCGLRVPAPSNSPTQGRSDLGPESAQQDRTPDREGDG